MGEALKGLLRTAISQLCIEALQYSQASYKTFEVREELQNNRPNDWKGLFSSLQADSETLNSKP